MRERSPDAARGPPTLAPLRALWSSLAGGPRILSLLFLAAAWDNAQALFLHQPRHTGSNAVFRLFQSGDYPALILADAILTEFEFAFEPRDAYLEADDL